MLELGAVFPIHEIGNDPAAIRDWAQAVEALGFSHIASYDHVIGADVRHRPGYDKPYTNATPFHEAMVLFGFLAACTRRVGLVPAIIALPQRQTVLAAKQAVEIDVLSGGRLRLGIGLGRYEIEYEALGSDFHTRGRRFEDQIELMRALWTASSTTHRSAFHAVVEAGLNPLPVQRPIPLWLGGGFRSDKALERIARLADGVIWYHAAGRSLQPYPTDARAALSSLVDRLRHFEAVAGRAPGSVAIEGQLVLARGDEREWREVVSTWRALGARYVAASTMDAGFGPAVDRHVALLERARAALLPA